MCWAPWELLSPCGHMPRRGSAGPLVTLPMLNFYEPTPKPSPTGAVPFYSRHHPKDIAPLSALFLCVFRVWPPSELEGT